MRKCPKIKPRCFQTTQMKCRDKKGCSEVHNQNKYFLSTDIHHEVTHNSTAMLNIRVTCLKQLEQVPLTSLSALQICRIMLLRQLYASKLLQKLVFRVCSSLIWSSKKFSWKYCQSQLQKGVRFYNVPGRKKRTLLINK